MLGLSKELYRLDVVAAYKIGQPFIQELHPSINGFVLICGHENRSSIVTYFHQLDFVIINFKMYSSTFSIFSHIQTIRRAF